MGKFNSTNTPNKNPDTTNSAGGAAFSYSDERQEIASIILSSMVNGDSYYEKESARIEKIMAKTTDASLGEFLAKAMVYVRNDGNLRTVSHLLAVGLAENVKGSDFLRPALGKAMIRPDDATEMVALWNSRNKNKNIPNVLRRSIKDTLETKWDSYQLKKYFGANNAVKVSDLIKLTHPKATKDGQAEMWKQALEGTLPAIATVQTVNAGSTGEDRAQNYKAMLAERKLGIMGALKNIKNIVEANADEETVDMLCSLLSNEKVVLKSRLLPFRFVQAYNAVEAMGIDRFLAKKLLKAIEQGFIISANNIPIVEGDEKIAIMLDESGSMGSGSNEKSPFSIGKTLMASMMTGLDKDNVVGYLWADSARQVDIDMSPMNFVKNTHTHGMGTDLGSAIKGLIDTKTYVDKIVIFTDMQQNSIGRYSWGSSTNKSFPQMVNDYRRINPKVKVLFWNLQGYGTGTPMKLDNNVLEVSGFSDNMLSVAAKMWQDKNALIKEIENVSLVA